jgi:hypothetical protein
MDLHDDGPIRHRGPKRDIRNSPNAARDAAAPGESWDHGIDIPEKACSSAAAVFVRDCGNKQFYHAS